MPKRCDGYSVGVMVVDTQTGEYLTQLRNTHPMAWAVGAAGHWDQGTEAGHGTLEQAAIGEAEEELGVLVLPENLQLILHQRFDNPCRRKRPQGVKGHDWYLYLVKVNGKPIVQTSQREVKAYKWYSIQQLETLAHRSAHLLHRGIQPMDWGQLPPDLVGIEPVWATMLDKAQIIPGLLHRYPALEVPTIR